MVIKNFILLFVFMGCLSLNAQIKDMAKSPESAPIIESGRLVATITNTAGTLKENIQVPLVYNATRNPDFSMEGKIIGYPTIGPSPEGKSPNPEVRILKVEDDLATIVPVNKNLPMMGAVKVPYYYIQELTEMPHLTSGNPYWISSSKIMESMDSWEEMFLNDYQPIELHKGPRPSNFVSHPNNNYRLIPWSHSSIADEYQKLGVPITTEAPTGDNSSVVAVANALSYLYTKNDPKTNPTQVSKSFLAWAHDAYPLNDKELNTAWHPNDAIKPTLLEEGHRVDVSTYSGSGSAPITLHPERLSIPVTSGIEHRIDLARLLKAVQRFGVAFENEQPSTGNWTIPKEEVRSVASSRIQTKPIVVRCFNAWNDINTPTKWSSMQDYFTKMDAYQARYFKFITKEVANGHPVIITYLKEISPQMYIKRSFLVTGSGNPEHHQSLQFLTPNGRFETYNALGSKDTPPGEVIGQDPINPYKGLIYHTGSAFDSQIKAGNIPVWKNTTYGDGQALGHKGGGITDPKFEVYSLGFE